MDNGDNINTVARTGKKPARARGRPSLDWGGGKRVNITIAATRQIAHAFGVLAAMRGTTKSALIREMILRELREGARSAKDATVTELGEGAREGARSSEGARSGRRGTRRARGPIEAG